MTKDSLRQLGAHQSGCTEPYALNYNSQADIEDGSCEFFQFQIKVGIWPNVEEYGPDSSIYDLIDAAGFFPQVLRFGFSPAATDEENLPSPGDPIGRWYPSPCCPTCETYMDCVEFYGWHYESGPGLHTYTHPNYITYLKDSAVPSYVPPDGFHTGIGTEWTSSWWFWNKWLNYSPADYGVEHVFRIHMDLPDDQYLMYHEVVAEIRFDWLVAYWDIFSPYIESMRLTDAFDGALGIDVDVIEEIMTAPSQSYNWWPEMVGFTAHLHVTPKDPTPYMGT
jgi:hypothetical protein